MFDLIQYIDSDYQATGCKQLNYMAILRPNNFTIDSKINILQR
jgi:hypothetical protein